MKELAVTLLVKGSIIPNEVDAIKESLRKQYSTDRVLILMGLFEKTELIITEINK